MISCTRGRGQTDMGVLKNWLQMLLKQAMEIDRQRDRKERITYHEWMDTTLTKNRYQSSRQEKSREERVLVSKLIHFLVFKLQQSREATCQRTSTSTSPS